MAQKPSVFTATNICKKMHERNDVVEALLNGTYGIFSTTKDRTGQSNKSIINYIPKEKNESQDTYTMRLQRSYVTPYLANAIESATGQLFRVPPVLSDDSKLEPSLDEIVNNNVNLQDSDLIEFAIDAQKVAFAYGMVIVIGDYFNPSESSKLSDQIASGAQPYLTAISPQDLLGYSVDDAGHIKMLRFREAITVEDEEGIYGQFEDERIRIVTPTKWYRYKRGEKGLDELEDSGDIVRFDPYTRQRITDRVPVKVLYGRKIGVLQAAPVFEDLAWINVHHTQVNSDLSWSNHFALIPFLVTIHGDDVIPDDFKISTLASQINVQLTKDSDIKWIETTGKAQESGRKHLEDIEDRIQISTMSSKVGVTGAKETATGRAITANEVSAKLRQHAEALESFCTGLVELLASYMPEVKLTYVEYIANKDFDINFSDQEIKQIKEDLTDGIITRQEYVALMKSKGVYPDTFELTESDDNSDEDEVNDLINEEESTEPESAEE